MGMRAVGLRDLILIRLRQILELSVREDISNEIRDAIKEAQDFENFGTNEFAISGTRTIAKINKMLRESEVLGAEVAGKLTNWKGELEHALERLKALTQREHYPELGLSMSSREKPIENQEQ